MNNKDKIIATCATIILFCLLILFENYMFQQLDDFRKTKHSYTYIITYKCGSHLCEDYTNAYDFKLGFLIYINHNNDEVTRNNFTNITKQH